MQLKPERLLGQLGEDRLLPCYLIAGDEPLQVLECADAVRAAARRAGIEERVVLTVEAGFDWGSLAAERDALSLFASRRLLDLRLPSAKPGTEGGKALVEHAGAAGEDMLLVTAGKLDKRARQAKWVQALADAGALVLCYPVPLERLPQWLQQRAGARGLRLAPDAAALLAERAEGNMLAADQELEKLAILAGGGEVDEALARAATEDASRHDIFELADAALAGEAERALRILRSLRLEGVEPQSVSWVLGREIRQLTGIMSTMAGGAGEAEALREFQVWDRRRALVLGAMRRHRRAGLLRLSRLAARLECTVKGMSDGEPWQDCTWLALALAGRRWPAVEAATLG